MILIDDEASTSSGFANKVYEEMITLVGNLKYPRIKSLQRKLNNILRLSTQNRVIYAIRCYNSYQPF